jgi:Family of unknown function (DUF6510)
VQRVDGNAVAGALGQFLAVESTEARGRCASCGAIAPLGAAHVYAHSLAPGAVIRCAYCEAMLAVVVETGERTRLAFAGLAWIEVLRA